jgi:uncharacterized membrane protein YfcA
LTTTELLIVSAALLAGFIDAMAGGGGLVLLPALSLVVGAGPTAIGTHKPAALAMAAIALLVYSRFGALRWRLSGMFALMVGIGSLTGSRLALLIPLTAFPWLLALTCPVLLYIVWQKELWLPREAHQPDGVPRPFAPSVLLSGLACGVYDGAFGPGAGTCMFLCLLFFAHLPLLSALAAAKLANTGSAAVALASFAESGHVHWRLGAIAAVGALIGGYLGARQASMKAARVVRPALVVVVLLLVLRIVSGEVAAETASPGHFYRTVRLIVALLIATLIPFVVDRYARRSSRVIR